MDRRPTQRQPTSTSWREPRDGSTIVPLKRKLSDVAVGGTSYEDLMAQGKLLRSTASRIPPQESLYTCRVYYLNQALDAFQQALNASAALPLVKHTQNCLEQIRETQIDLMVLSRMSTPATSSAPEIATATRAKQGLRVTVRHRPLLHLSTSSCSDTSASVDDSECSSPSTDPPSDAACAGGLQHGMSSSPPSFIPSSARFRGISDPPTVASKSLIALHRRKGRGDNSMQYHHPLPPPPPPLLPQPSHRSLPRRSHDVPKVTQCLPQQLSHSERRFQQSHAGGHMGDVKKLSPKDQSSLLSVARVLMSIGDARSPLPRP
ncbi:hypothetical protein H310_14341 [Aphanomyces invadans]|uniref:Uncharacterized protein n=1 Tax=Aphanomyces invadans TaxID=157072 RepID=A0A024TAF5_9STRA|nr:hypothetical protein H310_14341 [Aphanomyces invadans]ETV91018.1 hypothetical protein H310_14341 [Aphanomyces invadans]|eukprot:XP_008880407.1 hypothetical protein H310_14341 [Aphanomyces invadans]